MVDLPTVPDRIVTTTAPTSSVSRSDIIGSTNLMAKAIGDVADAQMEIATRQAKEQAANDLQNQKVTRNDDGTVTVVNPVTAPIFGRAGELYTHAMQSGTIAKHSNIIATEMNDLHQQYPTDPAAFNKAADSWKAKYLQDHGGGIVGQAISQQTDQMQTQHGMAITNAASSNDLKQQDSSLSANQTAARNDVMAMLRGGASLNDPAVAGRIQQYDATTEARATNPLFGYSKDQAKLDRDTFHSEAAASRMLYNVDKIYKDQGPAGGKNNALAAANDILTNPDYKLSQPQREQYYHRAVGEIRANEAIRKQDLGEARAAYSELSLQSAAGGRIESDQVEQVAGAFRAAGDPGGAARVYSSFIRKPLNDDFGRQPLATQTQQLTALQGANAAAAAHKFFIGKGYTPEQSAGIVGNLVHESGMQPNAVGDAGTSGGLAQFHNERLTALRNYAKSVGKPATDFNTQLEFIDRELHTSESGTLTKLQAARTPEQAAHAFIDYERPLGWSPENPAGGLGYKSRIGFARQVFNGQPADTSMGPAGSAWLAANRKASVDDAATSQWKTVMDDYNKEGTRPSLNAVNDIVSAANATQNHPLLETIAADAKRMDLSGEFARGSLPTQHAEIARRQAEGERRELPPATAATQKDLQRRNDAITTGLKDNPIATTVTNFTDKFKPVAPLDFSSDQALAAGLKQRGQIAQFAQQNWEPGGAVSALDSADVAQVQGLLASPDPAAKGRIFNGLSVLPEDVRNATLAKIGGGRPDLMVSVAAGSMMTAAPDVGASIIRGQAAIDMKKGYLPEGTDAKALEQEFDKHIPASTFGLAARTDASGPYAVAQGLVKARYADLSAQSADTTGKLNTDRLGQAVNDVTGGILDHNGGKLIAPVRGMPQPKFDQTMAGITDADLGNGPAQSNLDAADAALKLTPQEKDLYNRHFSNLYGPGGVNNDGSDPNLPRGSRSTLYQSSVEHDGKTYNIPTVWDGKILPINDAVERVKKEGWDKFPAYKSEAEAEARYQQMHGFMDKDTAQYFKGNPQSVTTLNGEPVTANYLRSAATLESVGDGRYYVKLGKDPLKPVYAYSGANTESPQKFMLDLRNRPLGAVPPVMATALP
jgi:hypothetical protein